MRTSPDSFGPNAAKYSNSLIHASSVDLNQIVEWANPKLFERALDIATGSGNVALALAPYVKEVIAFDMTPEMLQEVELNAKKRNLKNVKTVLGNGEDLPFDRSSFDIVTLRLAMHHFLKPQTAIAEMFRILKPGGKLIFEDNFVPENEKLDFEINEIEKLRDPSHVRCAKFSELIDEFSKAGFETIRVDIGFLSGTEDGRMDFDEWVERINTPFENRKALKAKFTNADPSLVKTLRIIQNGDKVRFTLKRTTILLEK